MGSTYCPPVGNQGMGYGNKYQLTAGVGPTFLYGDIQSATNRGLGGVIKGDYRIYRGLFGGLELQVSNLKASNDNRNANGQLIDDRKIRNMAMGASLNLTIHPFQFLTIESIGRKESLKSLLLNGFYVGVGLGVLSNDYKERVGDIDSMLRVPNYAGPSDLVTVRDEFGVEREEYQFKYKTTSIIAPILNIGMAVPINKNKSFNGRYMSVVINSQFNFSRDDKLDGYEPQVEANRSKDMYNLTYIGFRYSF